MIAPSAPRHAKPDDVHEDQGPRHEPRPAGGDQPREGRVADAFESTEGVHPDPEGGAVEVHGPKRHPVVELPVIPLPRAHRDARTGTRARTWSRAHDDERRDVAVAGDDDPRSRRRGHRRSRRSRRPIGGDRPTAATTTIVRDAPSGSMDGLSVVSTRPPSHHNTHACGSPWSGPVVSGLRQYALRDGSRPAWGPTCRDRRRGGTLRWMPGRGFSATAWCRPSTPTRRSSPCSSTREPTKAIASSPDAGRPDVDSGLTGILFTQRAKTSPEPPPVFIDFWDCAYEAMAG